MQRCFLEKNISTHLACLSFLANVGSQGQVHLWSSPEWMSYSTVSDVWQPGYRGRGPASWPLRWHDTSFVVCQVEPCRVTSNTELSFLSQNLFYHFIEPSLVNYCYFESTGLESPPYHLVRFSSVQFICSVVSNSLWPHRLKHNRPPWPWPSPISGVYSSTCTLSRWCHSTISSSVVPFSSCPQSFPASGSFQMSQLFASGG